MISGVAVRTKDLSKRYGSRRALDGFSLSVPNGAVMGLVGANGAGKTTWMLTVAGLLRPTSGAVDLLGSGPFDAARHCGLVSVLPQDAELPPELSAEELLRSFARLQGLSSADARKAAAGVLEAVNLADRAKSPVRTLSHGMRKRVMVAQCFIGRPKLVLLDEPLNGLDPVEAERLRRMISAQRGKCTIVISSHQLGDIEQVCTHVAFVENGRVVRADTLRAVTQTDEQTSYVLSHEPSDMEVLSAAIPGAAFRWSEATHTLTCAFSAAEGGAAAVNRRLLPLLLAQCDVVSVSVGVTLEQAYLSERKA